MRAWLRDAALIGLLSWGLVGCGALQDTPPAATLPAAGRPTQAASMPPPGAAVSTPQPLAIPPTAPTLPRAAPSIQPSLPPAATLPSAEPTSLAAPVAAALPDPAGYVWTPVVSGLSSPISLANAGDGSGRLFIVEQAGLILILQNDQLLPQPFLDIRDRVGSQGMEQGLLGLAFHPQFGQTPYFYVNYTDQQGNTVIARFQVSPDDPNQADPASEKRLLQVDQPFPNHNGGETVFGPDGYLYLGLGDGGSAGDPQGNAQSLDTLLGKILRLDVDGGDPYAIPAGNPFASGGGRGEIWAYGLRNPWRFSFDRLTGDLYIADVGQNQWEEIDFLPAGSAGKLNFGWDYFEGNHPYEGQPPSSEVFIAPVSEYPHSLGCSVTGGVVYRGSRLAAWQGVYLYGDFCTGTVWGLLRDASGAWQSQPLFTNVGRVASFGEDEAGEVYLVDRSGALLVLGQR